MIVTKETIQNWLDHHDIKNYIINDDLTVDVNDSVLLYDKKLKEIPFKFRIVNGDFDCSCNLLQSLKNSPNVINGDFDCSYNQLINLDFCPQKIKGNFDCSSNELQSLKNCPKKIGGGFDCSHNKLKNLEYCPEKINGGFYCEMNQLTSLEYCPRKINGHFNCSENLLSSLEYCPQKINGSFHFNNNRIKKELLFMFNSVVIDYITCDFGNKEEFLNEVNKQKSLKEKEELNKNIISDFCKNKQKRL